MSEIIHIYFNETIFKKGDVLQGLNGSVKVISEPRKPWYKSLFELFTLGWYKAPRYYRCKVINHDE